MKPWVLAVFLCASSGLAAESIIRGITCASDAGGVTISEVLPAEISAFIGQAATEPVRIAVADAFVAWMSRSDYPVVLVDVAKAGADGILHVTLNPGKIGTAGIAGGRHFPKEVIANQLDIRSGDILTGSALQAELDWLARNPFHQARLRAAPSAVDPAVADIAFLLSDEMPLRFFTGSDTQGVDPLGDYHFRAGVQWGNALGLDHLAALQIITSEDPETYLALAGDWRIPLPWRHEIALTLGHANTSYDTVAEGLPLTVDGDVWSASTRWVVPARLSRTLRGDFSCGFEWRRFDSDITFGGASQLDQPVDVAALVAGSSLTWEKGRAVGFLGCDILWSPGGILPGSNDSAYEAATPGASADFLLARLQSSLRLPLGKDGWSVILRGGAQLADGPLLASEEINLAGMDAVRGYPERAVRGADGLWASAEILTPGLPIFQKWKDHGCSWQLAGFFDGGRAWNFTEVHGHSHDTSLAAAGIGLRAAIEKRLSWRVDFAVPLHEATHHHENDPRLHASVQLVF